MNFDGAVAGARDQLVWSNTNNSYEDNVEEQ